MNDDPAIRRKRLKYRSWHRGTKELDMFFGAFADKHLDDLTDAQIDRYETIIEQDEHAIYGWLVRRQPVPPELDNDVMRMILNFKFEPTGS